jgi:hypothetical protein
LATASIDTNSPQLVPSKSVFGVIGGAVGAAVACGPTPGKVGASATCAAVWASAGTASAISGASRPARRMFENDMQISGYQDYRTLPRRQQL